MGKDRYGPVAVSVVVLNWGGMWWNLEELLPCVNLSLAKKLIGQTATLNLANFRRTDPDQMLPTLEKHIVEYIEHILISSRERNSSKSSKNTSLSRRDSDDREAREELGVNMQFTSYPVKLHG